MQGTGDPRYALLSTEPMLLINEALCQQHSKRCEATDELKWEYGMVSNRVGLRLPHRNFNK